MANMKRIQGHEYLEMLEALPPASRQGSHFLLGEPSSHRICRVTGRYTGLFEAYYAYEMHGSILNWLYFQGMEPLTRDEFAAEIAGMDREILECEQRLASVHA